MTIFHREAFVQAGQGVAVAKAYNRNEKRDKNGRWVGDGRTDSQVRGDSFDTGERRRKLLEGDVLDAEDRMEAAHTKGDRHGEVRARSDREVARNRLTNLHVNRRRKR
jgi:hypothetical protein